MAFRCVRGRQQARAREICQVGRRASSADDLILFALKWGPTLWPALNFEPAEAAAMSQWRGSGRAEVAPAAADGPAGSRDVDNDSLSQHSAGGVRWYLAQRMRSNGKLNMAIAVQLGQRLASSLGRLSPLASRG